MDDITPSEDITTENTPAEDTPSEDTSSEDASTEDAASDDTPSEDAQSEDAQEPEPVAQPEALELTDSMMVEEETSDVAVEEPPPPQEVAQPEYQPYGKNGLVADQVEQASGVHIAQLAQAVAQERARTLGNQGITLEQLVREICTPVLKQWLDHNLPYMVERIVRQEIDRIVSRSEKL